MMDESPANATGYRSHALAGAVSGPVLVSIGLPVYNGEAHLRCALDSLLAQSYRRLEIVISDNASTDRTPIICEEYASCDQRIRYYRNDSNLGPTANFNRAFELAVGEYFMWTSHDDHFAPDYVQRCVAEFPRSERLVAVGSFAENIDPRTGEPVGVNRGCQTVGLPPALRLRTYMASLEGNDTNTFFYAIYRRAYLQRVMPIEKILAADHLLLAELSLMGEFDTVPEVLMHKRCGGASRDLKHAAQVLNVAHQWRARHPYLFRTIRLEQIVCRAPSLTALEKCGLSMWLWRLHAEFVWRTNVRPSRPSLPRGRSFGLKTAILNHLGRKR